MRILALHHEFRMDTVRFSWCADPVLPRPNVLTQMRRALRRSRVVALIGPRQAGKTTLACEIVPATDVNYFDLEDPASLARLAEPMTALSHLRGVVVIDEVQHRRRAGTGAAVAPEVRRVLGGIRHRGDLQGSAARPSVLLGHSSGRGARSPGVEGRTTLRHRDQAGRCTTGDPLDARGPRRPRARAAHRALSWVENVPPRRAYGRPTDARIPGGRVATVLATVRAA